MNHHTSVASVLLQSINPTQLLGEGSGHYVFAIGHGDLTDSYVLRVPLRGLLDPVRFADGQSWQPYFNTHMLERTSALRPAAHVPIGRGYGQAMLVADVGDSAKPFSIMRREPGKSLSTWLKAYELESTELYDARREEYAKAKLVRQLLLLPDQAFESLLTDRCRLSLAGYPNDSSLRNILFDPGNRAQPLALIDIYDDSLRTMPLGDLPLPHYTPQEIARHVDFAVRSFTYHLMCSLAKPSAQAPDWQNRFLDDYTQLCDRLSAVKNDVLCRLEGNDIQPPEHKPLTPDLRVDLKAPPETLVHSLRRIDRILAPQPHSMPLQG